MFEFLFIDISIMTHLFVAWENKAFQTMLLEFQVKCQEKTNLMAIVDFSFYKNAWISQLNKTFKI